MRIWPLDDSAGIYIFKIVKMLLLVVRPNRFVEEAKFFEKSKWDKNDSIQCHHNIPTIFHLLL